MLRIALFTIAMFALVAGLLGGCYGVANIDVADGYRDGTVQRVKTTGVIFKTNECEMIGGGMSMTEGEGGTATFNRETYYFSVTDPEVLAQISALKPGQRVRVHYRETLGIWTPRGNTAYFAVRVEVMK